MDADKVDKQCERLSGMIEIGEPKHADEMDLIALGELRRRM